MATAATDAQRAWVLDTLEGYWRGVAEIIARLPLARLLEPYEESIPPRFLSVALPDWASHAGVDGALLIPAQLLVPGDRPAWERVDWLGTAFWFLHACAERAFEQQHGPIHSFRFRLRGWDDRHWDHAWVNRIAVFLREWAARRQGVSARECCGPLPAPEMLLTHDVDAVRKTWAIRLKQTAFHGFNWVRSWVQGRWREGAGKLCHALAFLCRPANYWRFEELTQLETQYGLKSQFNFYGGTGGFMRRPRDLLLDPGYSVETPAIRAVMRSLQGSGCGIGLHPSFAAWNDADRMAAEKSRVERALGAPINQVRMHWLRFSWHDTWHVQQLCGLRDDSTLGFNDRPGFRNGAALVFHPWDRARQQPMALRATPMVLMDSQLYDYATTNPDQRRATMTRLIREVHGVGGKATIIWHPHVLSPDYGWGGGYREFLHLLAAGGNS
ncbi:MAG: hypothetical protein EXR98_10445 [Gemmataceae bacterium]|nr:hypothetical protein [Gemmataceae bacterium]